MKDKIKKNMKYLKISFKIKDRFIISLKIHQKYIKIIRFIHKILNDIQNILRNIIFTYLLHDKIYIKIYNDK